MHTSAVWERNAAFPADSVTLYRPTQSMREEVVLHRGVYGGVTQILCAYVENRLELLLHPLTFTYILPRAIAVCERLPRNWADGSFPIKKRHFTCPASAHSVYTQYAYAAETRALDTGGEDTTPHTHTLQKMLKRTRALTADNMRSPSTCRRIVCYAAIQGWRFFMERHLVLTLMSR